MFHLHAHQVTALRTNHEFLKVLHHLRHLGCRTGVQCEGEMCVADIELHGALSACMQREIQQALDRVSQQICRAALVSVASDRYQAEYHIGPGAHDADRAYCLRRAIEYAHRAGEPSLVQALSPHEAA